MSSPAVDIGSPAPVPGKAIPTLHRCAELGTVQARDGALPHPDLPRF
jgi:hypothetical protein